MSFNDYLCWPFPHGAQIVPAGDWMWAHLRGVRTTKSEGMFYLPQELFEAVTANPCFHRAMMPVRPYWQGRPENYHFGHSTVIFAYVEKDLAVTNKALQSGVCMFGAEVRFIPVGDHPTIVQCTRCHEMGHARNSSFCKVKEGAVRCHRCGGPHDALDHGKHCKATTHVKAGVCNCIMKCLLCGAKGHHARACQCPKRGAFAPS